SPNKSTVEVIFTSSGSKNIQAWGYSNATGQAYGTAQITVIGVQPVYVTGQVRQWGGSYLSGVWVDAQEIGGSGSMTAQTQHDGSYGFYVPQGTSWRVLPRGNRPCAEFYYYPQEIYNVQNANNNVLNFYRYNPLYYVDVQATNCTIIIMQNSGEQAVYSYQVRFQDGTEKIEEARLRGTEYVLTTANNPILWVSVVFPELGCSQWTRAN
ncbi:MAG: hypothetical protein ACOVQA_01080, partial [Thermoflexibacteraceae bacterium]